MLGHFACWSMQVYNMLQCWLKKMCYTVPSFIFLRKERGAPQQRPLLESHGTD